MLVLMLNLKTRPFAGLPLVAVWKLQRGDSGGPPSAAAERPGTNEHFSDSPGFPWFVRQAQFDPCYSVHHAHHTHTEAHKQQAQSFEPNMSQSAATFSALFHFPLKITVAPLSASRYSRGAVVPPAAVKSSFFGSCLCAPQKHATGWVEF